MAQYEIPNRIRSDPGTVFMSEQFKQFRQRFCIKHVTYPVRDHRVNGKIEMLTRTTNDREEGERDIPVRKTTWKRAEYGQK